MAWHDRDYNRADYGGGMSGGPGGAVFGRSTGMTLSTWLIIINAAVFLLDNLLTGSSRAHVLSLSAAGEFRIDKAVYELQLWRWISYQFLHHGFSHLLFNMIALYFFGPLIERWWGNRRFLAFYLLCGVFSAVLFTLLAFVPGLLNVRPGNSMVGASGSIFGILAACAVLFPHQRVMLLFPPIPMTMRTLALVFLGIAAVSVIVGSANAGGEAAHLGGAALGYFLVRNPRFLDFADRMRWGGGLPVGQPMQQRRTAQRRQQQAQEDADVNRILDKVRQQGLHRLSAQERRTLKRATDRQQRAG